MKAVNELVLVHLLRVLTVWLHNSECPQSELSSFGTYTKNFNCFLSVHVDNYTIIVPTKCTSLLKAIYITICTFLSLYS
jgi:hypothetical protein